MVLHTLFEEHGRMGQKVYTIFVKGTNTCDKMQWALVNKKLLKYYLRICAGGKNFSYLLLKH